jgi:hypothetical protein
MASCVPVPVRAACVLGRRKFWAPGARGRISFQKLTLRKRELLDQFVNVVFCTHLDHLRFI